MKARHWIALLGIVGVCQASAKDLKKLATEQGSGVEIEVSCDFDNGVPSGAVPVHFTVHNNMGRPGTWLLETNSNPYGEGIRSTVPVSLEPGQSRTVPMAAPLLPNRFHTYVSMRASGPGTTGDTTRFPYHWKGNGNSGPSQFLAMSRELAARSWDSLEKEVEKGKKEFCAARFDPADLAPDWRGFSGVEWLAMTEGEWAQTAPDVRSAIRQWVGQGGHFVLAARDAASVRWGEFNNATSAGPLAYGFGDVRAVGWDGKELPAGVLAPLIIQGTPLCERLAASENAQWPMLAALGSLKPNRPLILAFVIGFAVLVGPVNLFWFAPAVRRHRMFWTTPLLSLGGSVALIGVILLQEGTGGTGRRFTLIRLLPDTHEAVVFQNQVAKTSLLLGTGFRLSEDALICPIFLDGMRERTNRMAVEGRAYSGDWFRSRTIQAQRLASIRPTRAAVNVVGTDASGAPVVVSTIGSTLATVIFTDDNKKTWSAADVRTGEKTVLQPVEKKEMAAMREALESSRLPILRTLPEWPQQMEAPGSFFALVKDPREEPLSTHLGIRWKEDRVVYTGPVVKALQTGGAQP